MRLYVVDQDYLVDFAAITGVKIAPGLLSFGFVT
jgi:hypothetical protein